jgi:hypothetical protein
VLQITPGHLAREVAKAVEFRKKHTSRIKEIVRRYVGNWHRTDADAPSMPENDVFAWKAFMLPELCFGLPGIRVTAKRPSLHEDIGDAVEQALITWQREAEFLPEVQLVVSDALDGFGVMQVGLEQVEQGGGGEGPCKPYACRIPQDRFLIDPRCEHSKHARWWGHEYYRDADDLLASGRLDPELVEQFRSSGDEKSAERAVKEGDVPDRGVIRLVDIYLPEQNQICTLAMPDREGAHGQVFLRPPTDYWGPDSGPYQIFGLYDVPGDPYPMSAVMAWMNQSEEKNAHLRAAANEAASAKSFWLVDAAAPDVNAAIQNARSGDVIPVKDLKDKALKVETGTMSNQRIEYIDIVQQRLDRTSGFGDAQKGKAAGKTATESQIVDSNSDLRTDWMRQQIARATENVLRKVAWYLFYDPSVVMTLTLQEWQPDPMTGAMVEQPVEATYLGGIQAGQEEMDWTDFNLEIEATAMRRQDDTVKQQRLMQLVQLIPAIKQAEAMGANARWLTDEIGSSMNYRRLNEILFPMGSQFPMAQSGMVPPHMQGAEMKGQNPQGAKPMGGGGLPQTPPVNANLGGMPDANMGSRLAMA